MRSAYDLITAKGTLLVLVLLLGCFLGLPGCTEESELPDFTPLLSETDGTETEGESSETSSETSLEPFAREIRIFLPDDSGEALLHRASMLGEELRDRTGLHYTLYNHSGAPVRDPDVYEIVLGYGTHADAVRYMTGFRRDDYICAATEYAAVIGGLTEEATILALDDFYETLLPSVSSEKLMDVGVSILKTGVYDRGVCSLNGLDLSEWRIVCDTSSEILCAEAERLRDAIEACSGYMVAVNSSVSDAKRTIRLSIESGETSLAHMIPTEEGVTLRGEDAMGLSCVVDSFCERLFEPTDEAGNCQAALQQTRSILIGRSRFHVSLLIGDGQMHWASASEIVNVTDWIYGSSQDAVAMTDLPSDTLQYLQWNLMGRYNWQTVLGGAVGTVKESSASLNEDKDMGSLLFDIGLEGEKGGIRWLCLREGDEIPEWIFKEEIPVVLTVFGETDGAAGANTAAHMDCLYRGSVYVDGASVAVCVYTTAKQLRVEAEVLDKRVGILDLWIERLY